MDLGKRIKLARKRKSVTMKNLADALAIHFNTLGNYERGYRVPDENILRRISQILEIDFNWLIEGDKIKQSICSESRDSYSAHEFIDTNKERQVSTTKLAELYRAHALFLKLAGIDYLLKPLGECISEQDLTDEERLLIKLYRISNDNDKETIMIMAERVAGEKIDSSSP